METGSNIDAVACVINIIDRMATDPRINVWHIGILLAIADISYHGKGSNPVTITRKLVMRLSHIQSLATYHKCIRQMEEYGYIKYSPSYNHYRGTTVELMRPNSHQNK